MTTHLTDLVKNAIEPASLGGSSGVSTEQTLKAMDLVLPALTVMLIKRGSTESGAISLIDFIAKHRHETIDPDTARTSFADVSKLDGIASTGASFLKYLVGDRLSILIDKISSQGEVPGAVVNRLFKLCAPLTLGALGQQIETQQFDGAGLKSYLQAQIAGSGSKLSPDVKDLLGLEESDGMQDSPLPVSLDDRSLMGKILPWIVLLLTSLALLYFLGRGCSDPVNGPADGNDDTEREITLKLPDGIEIRTMESSAINALYKSMDSNSDRTTPFVLDKVSFETSSAQLTTQSYAQLDRLVALLQAYPVMAIRLEGHSDNTGNAKANLEMSNQQALAIKYYLEEKGIGRERIRALGRGQTKPMASNNTPEGQHANRRIEVYISK